MNTIEENGINSVTVLIDLYTRNAAETITYDAITKQASVVSDIREVTDAYYGAKLVFFESSVPSIVTPEVLRQIVTNYNVTAYLVYQTEEVLDLFRDIVHGIRCSFATIDWNLIYAVINDDKAILENYQRKEIGVFEMATLFDGLPAECVDPINKLYRSYLSLGQQTRDMATQLVAAKESLANYESVATRTTGIIKELKDLYDDVVRQNRMLAAMLSESYDVTFAGMYMNRPKVLYIKSISHLSGIDNLIMVLYSVLTKQYKVSAKVVKLVDSANAVSLRYVPNIYFPLSDSYNTHDVLVNDFLMSLASYNLLMGQLMLNRSRLDVLIVHDVRGTMNSALDASLYDLRLNEMSADYATMVEYTNVLSDYTGAEFQWSFTEVSKFTGTNAAKLANHPCVTKILDYIM